MMEYSRIMLPVRFTGARCGIQILENMLARKQLAAWPHESVKLGYDWVSKKFYLTR